MASLTTILKTIGKDFGHLEGWIQEGLTIAAPIVGIVDPPLAPIIAAIEAAFQAGIILTSKIDPAAVQQFVTAMATAKAVETSCNNCNQTPTKTC